jgi:hypothetical protein
MRSSTWFPSARSRDTGLHELSPDWLCGSTGLELAWGEAVGAAGPPHLLAQRLQFPHQSRNSESWQRHAQPCRQLLTLAKKSDAIP